MTEEKIQKEKDKAKKNAFKSLAKYKFIMFGYWAAIWVHLNAISDKKEANPFKQLVQLAATKK
jgi:hypothetical protein